MKTKKTILITGASSGIGKACARLLHEEGNALILTGRSPHKLEMLKEELSPECHIIPYDLNDLEHIGTIFEKLANWNIKLDGLIHSAGVNADCPVKVNNIKLMEAAMRVNCFAFIEMAKYFYKAKFSYDGAAIVAVSSLSSLRCDAGMAPYSASKAALNAAVKTMSKEFLRRRIRVNAILPGAVDTPMARAKFEAMNGMTLAESSLRKKQLLGLIPPENIAEVISDLLSGKASFMTGSLVPVSGGLDF